VNGANDPLSGQSAMLEEAKAIGELLKTEMEAKTHYVYVRGMAKSSLAWLDRFCRTACKGVPGKSCDLHQYVMLIEEDFCRQVALTHCGHLWMNR
jgi:hypothetical protein